MSTHLTIHSQHSCKLHFYIINNLVLNIYVLESA